MDWGSKAIEEIEGLKPYWVEKHAWLPRLENEQADAIDLFISMRATRHPDTDYLLRLRYQQDWEIAGRRESFADPEKPKIIGIQHWPTDVRGVLHANTPPAICLRGTYGFHSVLHTDRPMGETSLLALLLELQRLMNEPR